MTNCTHCECKQSTLDEAAARKSKEVKEIVAGLYHRALLLTEAEDPASDDFADLVDGVSETIDELKRTHLDFQRHLFYQIITEGMQAMHKRGLCLESVRHNDIIFRVDEGGEVVSDYNSQIPF
jgi:iron-sulfur cluster repair protein YtfE (RIC family)